MKKITLSALVALAAATNGTVSANTLICSGDYYCYEDGIASEKVIELGSQRPLMVAFTDGEQQLGMTYSEVVGLAGKFLFNNSMAFGRIHRQGGFESNDELPHVELEEYNTVDFVAINSDLVVLIVKPEQTVIVKRAGDTGTEPSIEMTFEGFIDALKSAYINLSPLKTVQGGYNNAIMDVTYVSMEELLSVCTTQGSGSTSAAQSAVDSYIGCRDSVEERIDPWHREAFSEILQTPEIDALQTEFAGGIGFNQHTFQHNTYTFDAVRSYMDLEGEDLRNMNYSETLILVQEQDRYGNQMGPTGSVTARGMIGNGDFPETVVREVRPQVAIEQREVATVATSNFGANSEYTARVDIDVEGQPLVGFWDDDPEFDRWAFPTRLRPSAPVAEAQPDQPVNTESGVASAGRTSALKQPSRAATRPSIPKQSSTPVRSSTASPSTSITTRDSVSSLVDTLNSSRFSARLSRLMQNRLPVSDSSPETMATVQQAASTDFSESIESAANCEAGAKDDSSDQISRNRGGVRVSLSSSASCDNR